MMPEKIWADYDSAGMCFWGIQKFDDKDTEYIRADIHAAEVERLNKALEQLVDYSGACFVELAQGDAYQGLHKMKYEPGKEAIVGGVYGTGEVWGLASEMPELAAWLKENR
jgi:hypothetical protein